MYVDDKVSTEIVD